MNDDPGPASVPMAKIDSADLSGHFAFPVTGGTPRLAVQRCRIARIGWERTILGPEYFITSLILAFISGR
jgi:hypothetical protein